MMFKKVLLLSSVVAFTMFTISNLVFAEEAYNPEINPADFSTEITNPYLTLPVGKVLVYEGETEDGLERIEITITDEKKIVMGVETIVYWDRAWIDGELVEDTKDWLAQDKDGNVWYFGEDVNNYVRGKLHDHDGAWEAGVDGALPGIWVKGNPQVGDTYRQEYYAGEAEDMVDVVAVNQTVTTRLGTFTGCLKTYDYTPLDPESREHKYYCPEVGGVVLIENLEDDENVELVEVSVDNAPQAQK
jgi:hypothetical protein